MANPISVNDTLQRLDTLSGQQITVYGKLSLDFEGTCLSHIPKSECHHDDGGQYPSSIWIDFDLEQIGQREQWLDQFDWRHVAIDGIISGPDVGYDGCGHFSMWPAEITATAVRKHNHFD